MKYSFIPGTYFAKYGKEILDIPQDQLLKAWNGDAELCLTVIAKMEENLKLYKLQNKSREIAKIEKIGKELKKRRQSVKKCAIQNFLETNDLEISFSRLLNDIHHALLDKTGKNKGGYKQKKLFQAAVSQNKIQNLLESLYLDIPLDYALLKETEICALLQAWYLKHPLSLPALSLENISQARISLLKLDAKQIHFLKNWAQLLHYVFANSSDVNYINIRKIWPQCPMEIVYLARFYLEIFENVS